jgi:drug/metabolite transporter (DMT)-like permease
MAKKKNRHSLQRSPKRSPRFVAYVFLLISMICWGLAPVIVKPSLEFTSPFRFLLYRYALAAALSLPVIWYYRNKIKHIWKSLSTIVLLELLGTTFGLSLMYFGLQQSSAIETSIIASTTPLFIVLAGVLFLKEKQEKRETVGLLVAFGATVILTLEPYLFGRQSIGISAVTNSGNLLILGANVVVATYYILAKKYYQKIPKFFVTAVSFLVGVGSFLLLALHEQRFEFTSLVNQVGFDLLHPSVWLAATYMAVFGSIIAGTAYLYGQNKIEASEASFFTYLQPLVAIPAGILLLQESVSPFQIVMLGVILAGVIIAERRGVRPTTTQKS